MSKKNTTTAAAVKSLVNRQTVQVMLDRHAAAFARNGITVRVDVQTADDACWYGSDYYSIGVSLNSKKLTLSICATHITGEWSVTANPSISLGELSSETCRLYSEMFGIACDLVASMTVAVGAKPCGK